MVNGRECNLFALFLLLCLATNGGESSNGNNLGDSCRNFECELKHNLICNNTTKTCQCKKGYKIIIHTNQNTTYCLKAAKLEEECYNDRSCLENDENSLCLQVVNKAFCACAQGYHRILDRTAGTLKCVQEREHTNSDLTTFIGVGVGMTLFCGLTCLVLRIFARARFGPRHHHYANAHLAPPPTVVTEHADGQEGPNSRQSSQRSSIGGGSRRQSMLAPPGPRPGDSRRASNSSIRSTSSARSYSLKNHHSQHRPSDPEMLLIPQKLTEHSASANVSPHTRNPRSPNKDSRSSSTGAIALN